MVQWLRIHLLTQVLGDACSFPGREAKTHTFIVQLLSHVWLFATPWTEAHQAFLSFTISLNLLKLISIESMMPSNHLVLCCPLFLLPSIFPSLRVFSSELALHIKWPKHWRFSINPSNENSGLISLWSLLAVQGTCKSLLHHCGATKPTHNN